MDAESIIEKLDFSPINESNMEEIISNLEYIFFTLPNEIANLTDEEKTDYLYEIMDLKISYLLEVISLYVRKKQNTEINYEIDDTYIMGGKAGYDETTGKIFITIIGLLIDEENTSSNIQTIFHEFSHQLQHEIYEKEKLEDILEIPPYYIGIAKHYAIDRLGDSERTFYQNNYEQLYQEIDADYNGLRLTRNFIKELYEEESNKPEELTKRVTNLTKKIEEESDYIEEELISKGRIAKKYLEELYNDKDIESEFIIDDKKYDSLIYTNKFLKEHKEVQKQIPLLRILYNGDNLKNYIELQKEREELLRKYPNKTTNINRLYDYIIKGNPILSLSKYLYTNDEYNLEIFLKKHPTILEEYSEEIDELIKVSPSKETIKIKQKKDH